MLEKNDIKELNCRICLKTRLIVFLINNGILFHSCRAAKINTLRPYVLPLVSAYQDEASCR